MCNFQPNINIVLDKGEPRFLSSVLKRGSILWQSLKQWNTVSGVPQNLRRGESVWLHLKRKVFVSIAEWRTHYCRSLERFGRGLFYSTLHEGDWGGAVGRCVLHFASAWPFEFSWKSVFYAGVVQLVLCCHWERNILKSFVWEELTCAVVIWSSARSYVLFWNEHLHWISICLCRSVHKLYISYNPLWCAPISLVSWHTHSHLSWSIRSFTLGTSAEIKTV